MITLIPVEDGTFPNSDRPPTIGQSHGMQLYNSKVVIDAKLAKELHLEEKTLRADLWHNQRKLTITASIMKEVCHQRVSTSCTKGS